MNQITATCLTVFIVKEAEASLALEVVDLLAAVGDLQVDTGDLSQGVVYHVNLELLFSGLLGALFWILLWLENHDTFCKTT